MDFGHVLEVCSLAPNLASSVKQNRGCKLSSGQLSEVALSYNPHRKQKNNDDLVVLFAHLSFKLEISPISGCKGPRTWPGTGDGSGTNNTHSTEPCSGLVAGSTGYADGFGAPPRDHQKQTRKRLRDDDGSFPPKKLPTRDQEISTQEFLCPFYVMDRHPFHECSKRRFKRTSDVRQHICRVHIQAPHCPTCGETFVSDRPLERRNTHIAARTCQNRPFSIPGITVEQFDAITNIASQSNRHRPSAVERWMLMWREIYPGADDPDSPYSSGETDLIQGMLDVLAAIRNTQSQALSSGTPMANFGPHELSIIDRFINVARQFQLGYNHAATLENSLQTPSGEPESTHAAQEFNTSASSSRSIRPPTAQAGDHGLAANTLVQGHAPPLVQPSGSEGLDWGYIHQPDFGEGSSQSLANQEDPWGYLLQQFGHYPWDYRPT